MGAATLAYSCVALIVLYLAGHTSGAPHAVLAVLGIAGALISAWMILWFTAIGAGVLLVKTHAPRKAVAALVWVLVLGVAFLEYKLVT
jgi:amino acid permease